MPSSSSNSSSSTSLSTKASPPASPPPAPPHSPLFFPINETEDEVEEDHNQTKLEEPQIVCTKKEKQKPKEMSSPFQHTPTPLHPSTTGTTTTATKHSNRKRPESTNPDPDQDPDDRTVSCNKCRPTSRDKISVIPIDINKSSSSSNPSPNGIFKSFLLNLTKKSPKSSFDTSSTTSRDEQWKIAVAELSHKLIQATRKRDEALLEASRLKFSMAELEKKLNKLEIYCHELKNGLDVCSNSTTNSPYRISTDLSRPIVKRIGHHDKVIESFVNSVSESRSSVRVLSRSLTLQLRQMGVKIYERISLLLQPYDVNISFTKNPRSLLFYLEALLNRAFYEDFEGTGFQKNGSVPILNPIEKCEANYGSFTILQGLSWDEVLNKGTRHFSEEFSRFCDRKMSEIVAMLGWNRAWPEPLLQAFFGAAKGVWLVHLLACSMHPSLPIFRVDKDVRFDVIYMEDMGGDKARKLVPDVVRIMVAPGFYVYNNVVKCKVICRYSNSQESTT
ncbi:hypothetical protein BVC80_1827g21 [Macleaya cordata]|uniref:DUF641 domain-containing protein n=1 Tax=Macleaya cordata TaxID=56857 RepID=A0A200QBB0_MACCD|nr:hypothetical protein BVC80_1827g21 [Macleaya cordata]